MKRKKVCAALLCTAMAVSGVPLGAQAAGGQDGDGQEMDFDIYVSPDGSDSEGDGSEENPYATIDKAREAAQKVTAEKGSALVSIGEGRYFLEEPVTFGPEDSNVTYVGSNAVLTGAKTLKDLKWDTYDGEIQVTSVEPGLGIAPAGRTRQADTSEPFILINGAGIPTGSQGKMIPLSGFPTSGSAIITEGPACSPALSW